jgi:hypothetical protein
MNNISLIKKFEGIILLSLFAEESTKLKPYFEKGTGFLKGDYNAFLKDQPDRGIKDFICFDPTEDRIYADWDDLLVKPIHETIGKSSEFITSNDDGSEVIWVRYDRVNQLPKRIAALGQFRFGYVVHRKYAGVDNKGYYFKEFVGFNHHGKPIHTKAKGTDTLFRTRYLYETLVGHCSIKEDLYRKDAIHVKLSHGDRSLSFPLPIEFYKEEFITREGPRTQTGRRKPILHSVCEHMRKNKITIEKFNRGLQVFYVDDVKVELSLNKNGFLDLAA